MQISFDTRSSGAISAGGRCGQGWALALALGCMFAPVAQAAETYTILYMFQCPPGAPAPAGEIPNGPLILDSAGNLYGTTANGGAYGFGTVFELSSDGTETVLYSFGGSPADGSYPYAGLIRDAAGNFYGTTEYGGAYGNGTVFELATTGVETVLHSFTGLDGGNPVAPVVRDSAGNLYGTTYNGGLDLYGTVFELSAQGALTVLHNFTGGVDGGNPMAGLLKAGNSLSGTAVTGAPMAPALYSRSLAAGRKPCSTASRTRPMADSRRRACCAMPLGTFTAPPTVVVQAARSSSLIRLGMRV